ncbi:MAG: hypothetical protein ACYS3S_14370 [Planctomycetota bacterium]
MRHLRRSGKKFKRFERLAKIRMASYIIFQYPPLSHYLGGNSVKPITTDSEDRPPVGEIPVDSFPAHVSF